MFCSHQEQKNVSEGTHVYINPASGLAEIRGGLQDEARREQTGANSVHSELLLLM